MDKHEMETERTQSYKAQIKETFLDTAVGWWDAITSSLIQCQAQNAQWHQCVSSDPEQLQKELYVC